MTNPLTPAASRRPQWRFAVVSAVYGVERYLPDFIASLEAQSHPLTDVQVILVDDGSTDDSAAIALAWAQRRPDLVTVVQQPNAGQASARNRGLALVDAEWVTFIDPDDTVATDYLAVAARVIDAFPQSPMIATSRIMLDDVTGELTDTHPLSRFFAGGDQFVDLQRFPEYFWHHVGAAFFRVDELRRLDLRFDERIRPNFEDGHFCVRYLLGTGQRLTFAASARYHYRRRADQSSTLQGSFQQPGKYTTVPRLGYLDVLQRAVELTGGVPEWLQNLILYELTWYFTTEDALNRPATAGHGPAAAEFVDLLRRLRGHLDTGVIESFRVRRIGHTLRDLLNHGLVGERWHSEQVVLDRYRPRQQVVRIRYRYVGEPPDERVLLRGRQVEPAHAKTRTLRYFDHDLMHERILWVSTRGTLRVVLNGRPQPLVTHEPAPPITQLRPAETARRFAPAGSTRSAVSTGPRQTMSGLSLITAARSWPVRRRFAAAWVLIDRTHVAGDNAERLFEYLRAERPDLNAWFVIEPGTPDWTRLRSGPHRNRVVGYGTTTWKLLMLNCAQLISSQADAPVTTPSALKGLPLPRFGFTFLQHGVITDDLSRWLNTKWMIDLVLTSTPDEHRSLAGDGRYLFTGQEARLTGLPRFDRLARLAEGTGTGDLLLVAPTWRRWLNGPDRPSTQRRDPVPDLADTEYWRTWSTFLADPNLHALAARHRLPIVFLPHPNVDLDTVGVVLPEGIESARHGSTDVQQLLARTRLLVTDYSSTVFDAAYLDRGCVHFQFDRDRVLGGDHTYEQGYFDYVRDGLGPVTSTVGDTVLAVADLLDERSSAAALFAERREGLFAFRDQGNCARVVEAIEQL